MTCEIKVGAILIKDDALLPKGLKFKSEPCVPSWKIVTDFDGYGLDREIGKQGWTFFSLASATKAGVFGIDGQTMIRRAIERILKSPNLAAIQFLGNYGSDVGGLGAFPGNLVCNGLCPSAAYPAGPVSFPCNGSFGVRCGEK